MFRLMRDPIYFNIIEEFCSEIKVQGSSRLQTADMPVSGIADINYYYRIQSTALKRDYYGNKNILDVQYLIVLNMRIVA